MKIISIDNITGIGMDPTLAAYLAGVIDSDGSIGIIFSDSAAFAEHIQVGQVETEAIDLLRRYFGGSLWVRRPIRAEHRPLSCWQVSNRKAVACLLTVHPFLRIKRAQAENCFELRRLIAESRAYRMRSGRGHVGGASRPDAITVQMQALKMRAHQLNGKAA
jgi:hypothetical protein